jgi:hypothetical protein
MWTSVLGGEPRSAGPARDLRGERAVAQSALVLIAGILLSGPLALAAVALVHPQPPWQGPARFADELHWIQAMPYAGGFVLIGGCVALIASLHELVPRSHRARANVALALTAAFAALIVLNYVVQTTFVPALASSYRDDNGPLIAALTMTNPRSLGWALEMWGYAVFGFATWLITPAFRRTRLERVTAHTFVGNGVMSIAGAITTAIWPGSAHTLLGFIGFALWNAWMLTMAVLVLVAMHRRT